MISLRQLSKPVHGGPRQTCSRVIDVRDSQGVVEA